MQLQRLVANKLATSFVALSAIIVLVLAGPTQTRAETDEQEARTFIEGLAEEAIGALTDPNAAREQRQQRARHLLNDNFALQTIGRFVLGRYWRVATPQEQKEYLDLFEQLIIVTYVDRFSQYSGEKLTVTGSSKTGGSGDVIVFSEISRPGGGPVEVGWRVRSRDGKMQIVDVYVERVSMGITQRDEFASIIQNNGGKVSSLLDEMRKRIAISS
ncbi:MAG: ABC transporter substrate-binding protein [Hyphomicrobiales bacterium]|nr:ABC transporter substrate-binding protein [Hyphomicrobiales bacterium]